MKERNDGMMMLYEQDWDDIREGADTISVFRIDATNWKKLRKMLDGAEPSEYIFDSFYEINGDDNWFRTDLFQVFCNVNDIAYEFERINCIWFKPEKDMTEEMMELLEDYRDDCGYTIPEEIPDPQYPLPKNGYWPIKVDLKARTMCEMHGVTVCAAYCMAYAMMTYSEIKGFFL